MKYKTRKILSKQNMIRQGFKLYVSKLSNDESMKHVKYRTRKLLIDLNQLNKLYFITYVSSRDLVISKFQRIKERF